MFLLVIVSTLGTVYGYTGLRLITALFPHSPTAVIAWIAVALLAAMPVSLIWLRSRNIEGGFADAYAWITYLSMGYVTITFGLLLLRDLCWIGIAALRWAVALVEFSTPAEATTVFQGVIGQGQGFLVSTTVGLLSVALALSCYGVF